jgi:small ligand-binding sensory domain FIST
MAKQYQFAIALDNHWENLADECIRQIDSSSPDNRIGFLYTTDLVAIDMENLIEKLRNETDIQDWVGTVGIGICAGDSEIYDTRAISLMVMEVEKQDYRLFQADENGLSEFIKREQDWLANAGHLFGVVHGDPRKSETTVFLKELKSQFPGSFFVGGLSSSQTWFPQVAGTTNPDPVISGVLFSDKLETRTSLTQGCTPIGDKHIITECKHNYVSSINDQPALDVFKQDIGEVLSRDLQKVGGYIFVGLSVSQDQVAEDPQHQRPGEYKVRNIMGIDTQYKTIIVGDQLKTGQTIQFCKRDNQSAWQDHIDTLKALKASLDKPVKGGIYISCLGRGRSLFGDNSQELQAIRQELGEFPLVGFFANGEVARHELYGYTGVLTLFL